MCMQKQTSNPDCFPSNVFGQNTCDIDSMPFLFIQLLALSSSSPLFSLFLSFRLSDPLSLPQFDSLSLSRLLQFNSAPFIPSSQNVQSISHSLEAQLHHLAIQLEHLQSPGHRAREGQATRGGDDTAIYGECSSAIHRIEVIYRQQR